MKNIKSLLDKYWAGETSIQDEKALKDYYRDNPGLNSPEKAIFSFFDQEKAKKPTKIFKLPEPRTIQLKRYIFSIAASLLLLAGAFWAFDNYNKSTSNEVIVTDPQVALEITKEAFAFLNGKVYKGEKALRDNIVHLDKTLIFKNL